MEVKIPSLDINLGSISDEEIPIFPRQIPWNIIIVPTNKFKYNPFGARSYLNEFAQTSAKVERKIDFAPHFDSRIGELSIGEFLEVKESGATKDMFQEVSTSGLYYTANKLGSLWTSGLYTASPQPSRSITPVRKLAQIVSELVSNYETYNNSLDWFTILSRLRSNEYAILSKLDKTQKVFELIEKGLFGLEVINIHKKNETLLSSKTSLKSKKVGASDDIYYPIKLFPIKNNNNIINDFAGSAILPPTESVAATPTVVLFDGTNLVGTTFPSETERSSRGSSRESTTVDITFSETEPPFTT